MYDDESKYQDSEAVRGDVQGRDTDRGVRWAVRELRVLVFERTSEWVNGEHEGSMKVC